MDVIFSDQEIKELVKERKPLPENWLGQFVTKPKRGHKEHRLDLTGDAGNKFGIIIRKSVINPIDFSVILTVRPSQSSKEFRLRRYNGKSHEHTNPIEKVRFYDFHIHLATERYQLIGKPEEFYAKKTNRYKDTNGALQCLIADANFEKPSDLQWTFFEEV